MADTSESDGVENRVPDHDNNASSTLPDDDLSKNTTLSEEDTSIATSLSKRIKMDGDGDGAPSSSEASPRHQKDEQRNEGGDGGGGRESAISFDSSAESTPRRAAGKSRSTPSTPQTSVRGHDLSMVDMKTSWDGSAASGGSTKGETTDGETGYKVPFKHRAGMLADPVKIAKEREKEERVRQARERLKEERQKKLEELKEQQRIAQENREKQLEMRRRKIEDLRRRDSERRAAVEERRKMKEEIERARRESILQKAEERVARYEAWKAGGRKGGRGHVLGFGSATPRDICQPYERPRRSSSHSALQRRSPNGSDMDSMRPQRRALSACSAVRRHCCVDINRIGTSTPVASAAYHHYQRPANAPGVGNPLTRASMTASMPSPVRLRENKSSRKQRPASVASSMPSFVGGEPAKSPRSKSTDRTGRDRSKTRPSRKDEKAAKDKENQSEKAQQIDEKEKEDEKDEEDGGEKKEKKTTRVSMSFFDRLATPKYNKKDGDSTPRDTPPKKDAPIIRVQFADDGDQDGMVEPERTSMRGEKPSPTHTKDAATKHPPAKDSHRGPTAPASGPTTPATPATAVRSISPGRKAAEKAAARTSSPSRRGADKSPSRKGADKSPIRKGGEKSGSSTPRITPPPSSTSTPTHGPSVPTPSASAPSSAAATPSTAPGTPAAATSADDGTTTPRAATTGSSQDITAEEYKARLAEKRRQAREKAEREAEEERKRQEEERLAEEERQRKEEEEQRRLEEEALRLAEEARRAEEERLQKAIEAEEKRRKEEAERLEQEKKAKEEADRKAKEEAERLEKEKQEKAKKEEEERLERKKKLEMIMKRVKPDSGADKTESPTKAVSSSPNLSQLSSSQNSPEEHEKAVSSSHEDSGEEANVPAPAEGSAVEPISSAMTMSFHQDWAEQDTSESSSMSSSTTVIRSMSSGDILDGPSSQDHSERGSSERLTSSAATTPSKVDEKPPSSESASETKSKFKSPLLQQLVENKGGDSSSGGPKFKSPLLQNLLGKTKVGARMGLSASMGDLSQNKDSSSSAGGSTGSDTSMTVSASSAVNNGSSKEIFKQGRDDEDKDEDTSIRESSPGVGGSPKSFENTHAVTNGIGREPGDAGDTSFPTSTSKSSLDSSPPDATRLPISMMSDSALGSSIEPHGDGEMSAPGMMSQSIIFNGHGDHKSHGMEDSSISLHSVTESVTNTASVIPFETVAESERQEDGAPPTQGDGQFEELIDLIDTTGKNNSIVGGTPIIAFEENNRRSDVTESLS